MDEKELKALIKTLVIYFEHDGVVPSVRAYGEDGYLEKERQIEEDTEAILELFNYVKRYEVSS